MGIPKTGKLVIHDRPSVHVSVTFDMVHAAVQTHSRGQASLSRSGFSHSPRPNEFSNVADGCPCATPMQWNIDQIIAFLHERAKPANPVLV